MQKLKCCNTACKKPAGYLHVYKSSPCHYNTTFENITQYQELLSLFKSTQRGFQEEEKKNNNNDKVFLITFSDSRKIAQRQHTKFGICVKRK